MQRFNGKRVALTGAAGGLGSLIAARMRDAGARVTGIDRVASPACFETWIADLSTAKGLTEIGDRLASGHVDILINAAGLQYFGPFELQAAGPMWIGYTVNLVAPAMLARAVVSGMRSRRDGQIVNIGSVMGSINYPYFATYSSAKAGLKGLSEALRRELADAGIDVTHIAPRAVNTAFNTASVRRFLDLVKMKADPPEDVANRIVQAIADRRKILSIGIPERIFAGINAFLPAVVDAGLASQARKARGLFQR